METQHLQELIDKDAIQQVRHHFAEALDYQNWELLTSLMAEIVEADFTAWGLPVQQMERSALVGVFQHSFSRPGLRTQHIYSNFRIVLDGDRASCKSNFLGQHYIRGFEGGEEFYLRAEYADKLIRTDSGWKISGLKLTVFYVSGNPSILAA